MLYMHSSVLVVPSMASVPKYRWLRVARSDLDLNRERLARYPLSSMIYDCCICIRLWSRCYVDAV